MTYSLSIALSNIVIEMEYPSPKFYLIYSLLPQASNLPAAIIAILSANSSASSKWWVVRTRVLFSYLTFSNISQIPLLVYASIPEVGSSKNNTFDPPIIAYAKDNFLLFPPLNVFVIFCYSLFNNVVDNIYSISYSKSLPSKPFTLPINYNYSLTVNSSYKTSL